ncbi:hemerythrin domain-containing protein [Flavobacterium maritimum]|mgnify:CR=1 FL=1|jgi:hypothetical protein|uniref:hemerythrin domain-containing protein n=1 Tax=Flavobacterium maritimum TaxID=3149042 RepID=UPI0032B389B0
MISDRPLKRAPELQPLSHDHHHGLQLCWKIRTGLAKKVDPKRIKAHTDWFFSSYLKPHYELEEKYLFPILDADNELVKRAITEHRRLEYILKNCSNLEKSLELFEKELETHIRFEERILFAAIQKIATAAQLAKINQIHSRETFVEKEDDIFWK